MTAAPIQKTDTYVKSYSSISPVDTSLTACPSISQPLIDVLYEYNRPLWEKAGYVPPEKPNALKRTVYAAANEAKAEK